MIFKLNICSFLLRHKKEPKRARLAGGAGAGTRLATALPWTRLKQAGLNCIAFGDDCVTNGDNICQFLPAFRVLDITIQLRQIAGKFLKQYAYFRQSLSLAGITVAFMVAVFSVSCGAPDAGDIELAGTLAVSAEQASLIKGPVFVAVSRTDNFDDIENDPMNSIAVMTEADLSAGKYTVDLTDTGIEKGDRVFIFAFSDND